MRYLVMGSEGFLGRALCAYLEGFPGAELIRADKAVVKKRDAGANCHRIMLEETDKLLSLCDAEKPDVVFNLAGSFNVPSTEDLFKVHSFAPAAFLKAAAGRKFKVVLIGSAAEYGIIKRGSKVCEDAPLNPVTDYGISKACQTFIALRCAGRNRFPEIVIARPFNIIGPGVHERLFFGCFTQQIARIEKGLQKEAVKVGNLESYRDILSIDKVAGCLKILAESGAHGEVYNICSSRPVKIGQILDKLLKLARKKISVEVDKKKIKTDDIPWSVGSNKKISCLGGTELEGEDLDLTIKRSLDWFRERVA